VVAIPTKLSDRSSTTTVGNRATSCALEPTALPARITANQVIPFMRRLLPDRDVSGQENACY
jgi:hypothetical protein